MREYYIDLGYKDVRRGMYQSFQYDEENIPRCLHGTQLVYNITFICHLALYHHTLYMKFGRAEDLARFLNVSNWILEHGRNEANSFEFPYQYPYEELSPPWISALGQGRILSVFSRAFDHTNDSRFYSAAIKAMAPYLKSVAEGGVQARFPDGGIAFEEYPSMQPNIVLNGLITSIVGLYDLSILGVEQAADIFSESIESLEGNLWRYDSGFWTCYDLTGYVASNNYHQYHIQQLWGLHEMTRRQIFKEFSAKWERYPRSVRVRFARGLTIAKKLLKHPEIIAPAIQKLFHRSV